MTNFKENYLNEMKNLITNIKNNKYMTSLDENDKKELINNLYQLYHKFVCFGYEMKKNNIDGNYYKDFFPCSHDFNRYLYYLTPIMFDNYYLKVVDIIDEFVKNNGDIIPKYLYSLTSFKGNWIIDTLEYFPKEIIESEKELKLPNYYCVTAPIQELSYYKQLFKKEENAKRFEKLEYPIYEYIKENRTNNKPISFFKNAFKGSKQNVCHYISSLTNGDIFTLEDISYNCGYSLEEVKNIIDELLSKSEFYQKKLQVLSKNKFKIV